MAKKEVTPTPFQKFEALAKGLIAVPVGEVGEKNRKKPSAREKVETMRNRGSNPRLK